jgi:hypothetical protein
MLNHQYLGLDAAGNDDYTNPDNIFEQAGLSPELTFELRP